MMRINVEETLRKAEELKANEKPPLVKVLGSSQEAVITTVIRQVKSDLLQSLWIEYNAALLDRNKLSTQIAHMVERGADQGELRLQYEKIESFRPQLQDLYDKIKYVERNGELPSLPELRSDPETLDSVKVKIDALVDKRCKLKAKLSKKTAKSPEKYVEWELELAQAEAEYQELLAKKKTLEGKA